MTTKKYVLEGLGGKEFYEATGVTGAIFSKNDSRLTYTYNNIDHYITIKDPNFDYQNIDHVISVINANKGQ